MNPSPRTANLLPELLLHSAEHKPLAVALVHGVAALSYGSLQTQVEQCRNAMLGLGLARGDRVGIYLEKCAQAVVASFAASAAGAILVPINPVLKSAQVGYILQDCDVRLLVTSAQRHALLSPLLAPGGGLAHGVQHVLLSSEPDALASPLAGGPQLLHWRQLTDVAPRAGHRVLDTDVAAILYTSGSTGRARRPRPACSVRSPCKAAISPPLPCWRRST